MSKACEHEYRQLKYHPKYISRNFEIRFYCIKCLFITGEIEL